MGSLPVLGAGIAAANLLAFREAFVILRGDEVLSLVSLAAALLFFGVGIALPMGFLGLARAREAAYLFFYWLTAIAIPAGMVCERWLMPSVLGPAAFQTPAHAGFLAAVLSGAMNVAGGAALALALSRETPPTGMARNKYALFLLGLAVGCGTSAYFIGDWFSPLLVNLCVSILLLTTAAVLSWRLASAAIVMSPPIWICLLVLITVCCSPLCQMLNYFTERWLFGPSVVEAHTSPTGVVTVTKQRKEVLISLNRVPMVHQGALRSCDEAVETANIPLLMHPEPQRVLVFGGSHPRLIQEALRQPVEAVEHLFADEAILPRFLTNIGYGITEPAEIKRLVTHAGDLDIRGLFKNWNVSYDVIIMDLPPASNAFLSRFYAVQFLSDLKALLKPEGLVAVRVSRVENAKPAQQVVGFTAFLRAFSAVFPNYVLAGAETTLCVGGLSQGPLALRTGRMAQSVKERGLSVHLPVKTEDGQALLREGPAKGDIRLAGTPTNRELKPITALCGLVGWLTAMPQGLRKWAVVLLRLDLETLAMALTALGFLGAVVAIFLRQRQVLGAFFGLCTGGFVAGVLLAVLLLADQCLYGTLYRDAGFVGSGFLIGGTSAAIIGLARRGGLSGTPAYGGLIEGGLLLVLGVVALMAPVILAALVAVAEPSARMLHLLITLPLVAALVGCAAGGLVPAASVVSAAEEAGAVAVVQARFHRAAVAVCVLSCALGLLVGATVLIPVLAIPETCYFCALFASVGIIVLIMARG